MKVIESPSEMTALSREFRRDGRGIGFVPTMGAFHNGHISLIKAAREENDIAAVSIFVNPLQFSRGEDYDRYPRQLNLDKKICLAENVDVIFIPSVGSMYPKGADTYIDQNHYPKRLCGQFRPGHFKGVMTVVAKLFNIVQPDRAYFGQKDYQQCLIIKRMVTDLNIPVDVRILPTKREHDGLAMSSRNAYLGPKQRKQAAVIYRCLSRAQEMVASSSASVRAIKREVTAMLRSQKGLKIDYAEIVNLETLERVNEVKTKALLAIAVRLGNVRLIDNMILNKKS